MSEQNKKIDESQQRMECLQKVSGNKDTYDEMCDKENSTKKRVKSS